MPGKYPSSGTKDYFSGGMTTIHPSFELIMENPFEPKLYIEARQKTVGLSRDTIAAHARKSISNFIDFWGTEIELSSKGQSLLTEDDIQRVIKRYDEAVRLQGILITQGYGPFLKELQESELSG
ncbi:MAG: hypothetical protein JW754_02710 [Candidatus Aenigmarchaeota archaeon]|nr:hypothetical protein [Candidatus Aenigmarchaeota archaeon]